MTTEYQDSIRDEFEVYIAKQLKLETVSKEVLAVQVFARFWKTQEYADKKLQTKWGEYEAACSQQIKKDAQICYDLGEKNIKQWRKNAKCSQYEQGLGDAPFDCEEAILNQGK